MAVAESFIQGSLAMRRVAELVAHAACTDDWVIVSGELGSGRTRVAREIHAQSERRRFPFETLSCSAYPSFGGIEGRRHRGTLFLSELDALGPIPRIKLLGAVDPSRRRPFRMIASVTHGGIDVGRDVLRIAVPPLRERREDIVPLADVFLFRAAVERRRSPIVLGPEATSALEAYPWPGNVRELESVIARAVALTTGSVIGIDALPPEIALLRPMALPSDLASLQYREVLDRARDLLSREYLVAVLRASEGNMKRAAEQAGVERESLYRLLKRYGLRADDFRTRGG